MNIDVAVLLVVIAPDAPHPGQLIVLIKHVVFSDSGEKLN
jgi:hypothetical protein